MPHADRHVRKLPSAHRMHVQIIDDYRHMRKVLNAIQPSTVEIAAANRQVSTRDRAVQYRRQQPGPSLRGPSLRGQRGGSGGEGRKREGATGPHATQRSGSPSARAAGQCFPCARAAGQRRV